MIVLTDRQRAVLAHKVEDPDAWLAHAISHGGEAWANACLIEKVERWEAEYISQSALPGYKTRAVREENDRAKHRANAEAAKVRRVEAKAAKDAEVAALVEATIAKMRSEGRL